jgi:diguanylate cyclase (GGDEF)-like protein
MFLIDSVADMTGKRDRDSLEVTVASVLFELLGSRRLAFWRTLEQGGVRRLHLRAGLRTGQPVAVSAPEADFDDLPALDSRPEFRACFESGAPLRLSDGGNDMFCHVYPVSDDHEVIGLLEVGHDAYLNDEQERLVGGMLRIYRNYLAILDYGEHDELTGLLNRKTFESSFERMLSQDVLPDMPTLDIEWVGRRGTADPYAQHWIAVIDIDFFKRINDRFGHLYGDEVLLLLARLMRSTFRTSDKLFRFGGEEFVVLLGRMTPAAVSAVLERLRTSVEAFSFPQVGRVTISIGYACVPCGDMPTSAFDRADEALYFAKQNGRNRIQSYEILLARGAVKQKLDHSNDVELF